MLNALVNKVRANPRLKRMVLHMVVHPTKARPQWWIRPFVRFYMKRGQGSVIYCSVRKDLLPNHRFVIGRRSVIEDYSVVNNGVGDIVIGDNARLGLRGTIIGPVTIEDNVVMGQNYLVSGLIHNYEDPGEDVLTQGVCTKPVVIGRQTYLGANCVVVAGVTIGEHCVVGAGSIVTHDMPPYTVCAGSPAVPIKTYDFEKQQWIKVGK